MRLFLILISVSPHAFCSFEILTILMIDIVDMGEVQDPDMATKKSNKEKGPIIEVNPDRKGNGSHD